MPAHRHTAEVDHALGSGFGPHLRPVRADDADAILEAFTSSPDMSRQGDVHDAASAEEYCTWLRGADRHAFAIVDDEPDAVQGAHGAHGRMVGLVAVSVDEGNRNGWFFYWLHPAYRGRGLASRAAAALAERALRPVDRGGWGLERLELGHRIDNPASGSVARAAGFLHEGTEREKFLIGGERVDVLAYGRLVTDPAPPTVLLPWADDA
ncbi:GNAT family N-acetyltransferase [Brachybacterium halotolerans subsp. kimchii]|uniref:GNAT family N-acetyltransferase n=1 Tax=Brachybacterium halotolerans TaxID=2795215 RepID=UPI001E4DF987|nr:GNAT family protein [Brachybacterium halotolerans]UEJ82265.1 GNAT family N-acetyltransferase [Brachybacterium halotolerans subsp. kimchii]